MRESVKDFTREEFDAFIRAQHSRRSAELASFKTLDERILEGRDERHLKRMSEYEKHWSNFLTLAATKTERGTQRTAFSRAEEYRERVETAEVIQQTVSDHSHHGDEVFLCSLRDDSSGYIAVAGGLYIRVDPTLASKKRGLMLRRSEDLANLSKSIKPGDKSWRTKPYLQDALSRRVPGKEPGVLPVSETMEIKGNSSRLNRPLMFQSPGDIK